MVLSCCCGCLFFLLFILFVALAPCVCFVGLFLFLRILHSFASVYTQYKFIVDGEWRHDENQPSMSGNYGTVNTVLLSGESDYVPAILSPQMHSGSNMDVDNEAFQRLVRVRYNEWFFTVCCLKPYISSSCHLLQFEYLIESMLSIFSIQFAFHLKVHVFHHELLVMLFCISWWLRQILVDLCTLRDKNIFT